ncbi:MAG TPA: tetratricopeptide repeat protein, partial [Pyrinomonadaceae bacterium]|nr:tetratricopeptide repeat protein [Pyrinomonadaceae bacterium]
MSIKPMVIAKEKIPTRRAQVRAWMRVFLVVITFSGAIACLYVFDRAAFAQSQPDELPGVAELKKGDYENAIKLLSARLASKADDSEAEKDLLRAYLETGRYVEAESAAKKFLLKTPVAAGVRHQLAEVLASTGRYAEAITEFERAATDAAKSPAEKLPSDLRRAEILELTGQEDRARPIFEALVAHYKDKQPDTAAELTAVGRALVHLERFQDANDVYREAIAVDATYLDAQLSAGELFTEKYNYGDAAQFLADALQVNPNSARALVDVARNKRIEGGEETFAALERALTINPNLVGALTFKAGLELEERDYVQTTADIEKAFKINPRSL